MIIYRELSSIEADIGFSLKTLYAITNNIEKHYRRVEIPKRDGAFRTLHIPDELLKSVQRRIASKILFAEPVSCCATAYKAGSCVLKNASPHIAKKKLLKLDIYHFFDSILYSQVKERVFPKQRFSERIRVLLTMLCYYKDSLPQGAPSSPVITNIVMRDFDEAVARWCAAKNIAYTRYCDDMTFSGDFDEREVISFIEAELARYGFRLNRKKTTLAPNTKRQTVTGIVVNKKPNVASDYRKKLRQEMYFIKKYGIDAHLERAKIESEAKAYLHGLLGRIAFVLSARSDDEEFIGYKNFVVGAIKEYKK